MSAPSTATAYPSILGSPDFQALSASLANDDDRQFFTSLIDDSEKLLWVWKATLSTPINLILKSRGVTGPIRGLTTATIAHLNQQVTEMEGEHEQETERIKAKLDPALAFCDPGRFASNYLENKQELDAERAAHLCRVNALVDAIPDISADTRQVLREGVATLKRIMDPLYVEWEARASQIVGDRLQDPRIPRPILGAALLMIYEKVLA